MSLNGPTPNRPKRKIPSRKLASRPFSSSRPKSSTTQATPSRPIQNRPRPSNSSTTKPTERATSSPPTEPHRTIPECFYLMGFDELPTPEELRARYRELAPRMHPDAQGTPEDFKQLTEAHAQAQAYLAKKPT